MNSSVYELNEQIKKSWSERMSHYGKQFILKQEVSKREILFINNMLLKMKERVPPSSNPFYAIPSDTGLVTLRTDGTLIAIKKNSVNQLVIYITVTKRIRFFDSKENPLIGIGTSYLTITLKIGTLYHSWKSVITKMS